MFFFTLSCSVHIPSTGQVKMLMFLFWIWACFTKEVCNTLSLTINSELIYSASWNKSPINGVPLLWVTMATMSRRLSTYFGSLDQEIQENWTYYSRKNMGENALDWVVCYFTGVSHRDPCSFHVHHLAANIFFLLEYWNVSLFSLFVFIVLFIVRQETGFWFIFHHVPTGPSEGLYSPGHTEHTPMGHFTNNRAHSNYRVSFRVYKWQIVWLVQRLNISRYFSQRARPS